MQQTAGTIKMVFNGTQNGICHRAGRWHGGRVDIIISKPFDRNGMGREIVTEGLANEQQFASAVVLERFCLTADKGGSNTAWFEMIMSIYNVHILVLLYGKIHRNDIITNHVKLVDHCHVVGMCTIAFQ